jgi:catalase
VEQSAFGYKALIGSLWGLISQMTKLLQGRTFPISEYQQRYRVGTNYHAITDQFAEQTPAKKLQPARIGNFWP